MPQPPKAQPEAEQTIPLFIVHPLTTSLEQALPYLFLQQNRFSVKVVEFNPRMLDMAAFVRPCVCLFSIVNETARRKLRTMLEEQISRRGGKAGGKIDHALRVVVISEEKQGLTLDSWHDFGAHEVIIAPILSRPLVLKLERHYTKALQAMKDQQEVPLLPAAPDVIGAAAKTSEPQPNAQGSQDEKPPQFVIHGIALGPNTFLFPNDERDTGDLRVVLEPVKQVVVSVRVRADALDPEHGGWQEREPGVWDFVVSKFAEHEIRYRFFGMQPMYDGTSKTWVFRGERPKLFVLPDRPVAANGVELKLTPQQKKKIEEDAESPANLVFLTTPHNGVIFFKNRLELTDNKVWYFTEKQWQKSPLRQYDQEDEKKAWGKSLGAPEAEERGLRDLRKYSDKSGDKPKSQSEGGLIGRAVPKITDAKKEAEKENNQDEEDIDREFFRALEAATRGQNDGESGNTNDN